MDWTLLAQGEAEGAVVLLFMLFWFACVGFSILLGVLSFAFWIWMLIDCVTNEPGHDNDKVVWILVIAFLQGIGALVYYFVRRPQRIAKYGR